MNLTAVIIKKLKQNFFGKSLFNSASKSYLMTVLFFQKLILSKNKQSKTASQILLEWVMNNMLYFKLLIMQII